MVVPNLSMVVGMPVVFVGVATSQKLSLLPWCQDFKEDDVKITTNENLLKLITERIYQPLLIWTD